MWPKTESGKTGRDKTRFHDIPTKTISTLNQTASGAGLTTHHQCCRRGQWFHPQARPQLSAHLLAPYHPEKPANEKQAQSKTYTERRCCTNHVSLNVPLERTILIINSGGEDGPQPVLRSFHSLA